MYFIQMLFQRATVNYRYGLNFFYLYKVPSFSKITFVRKIIHIDQDCFYAAVEMRDRGIGRNTPVAVGGTDRNRGVLCTCNYKARSFGCHSAMPTFQATKICPDLVLLPVNFELYKAESQKIRKIFAEYTNLIEPLSLDEASLDVSDHPLPASRIAEEIRFKIRNQLRLPSSAGIAPNKMLAKIASDWNKPNGQFEIAPHEIKEFMQDLPVRKLPGVGPKMAESLKEWCIETCGQLQEKSRYELVSRFRKFGEDLYLRARGIDDRPVTPNRIRKTISTETTFRHKVTTIAEAHNFLTTLFDELQTDYNEQFQQRPIAGVFMKIKTDLFQVHTINCATATLRLSEFTQLLAKIWERKPAENSIRLLGIGIRFYTSKQNSHQLLFPFAEK